MGKTYFESWNGDYFQFSDETKLLHIVKHEQRVVNSDENEIYGVVLEEGITGVSYFINNATLWISPVTTYQGQRIQYVTSDSDQPIDIYYWSNDFYEPMAHGAGIELRNEKGQVVFNSQGSLGSFVGSFQSTVTTHQKVLQVKDATNIGGYWSQKGFANLYFAIASKFWGVYHYVRVEEHDGKGKMWGIIPINEHETYSSDKGYWYNSPTSPLFKSTYGNPRTVVRYYVTPNRCDMYITGLYGYCGKEPVERNIIGYEDKPIYESWSCDSYVTVNNRWSFDGSPSCSVMMPFSLWLPAMVSEKGNKDIVHAVGVKFSSTGTAYNISLDDHLETLYVSKHTGGGSLEHLNHVIYSSHEEEVYYPPTTADAEIVGYGPDGNGVADYSTEKPEGVEGKDYKKYSQGGQTRYQRIADGCLTEGVSCDVCLAHIVSTT